MDKLSLINKITCQTRETNRDYYRELTEERKIVVSDEDIKLAESLNAKQMEGFNEIFDHVIRNKGKVFFVDGPGGTGKTSLQGSFGQSSIYGPHRSGYSYIRYCSIHHAWWSYGSFEVQNSHKTSK